jgi:hypothetical protein
VKQVSAVSAVTRFTRNRAKRGAVLLDPITVAERWKYHRLQSIRISLSTWKGRNLFDVRTWVTADGERV